jgi:hypothetical protein
MVYGLMTFALFVDICNLLLGEGGAGSLSPFVALFRRSIVRFSSTSVDSILQVTDMEEDLFWYYRFTSITQN